MKNYVLYLHKVFFERREHYETRKNIEYKEITEYSKKRRMR